jgi:hypothetical protein
MYTEVKISGVFATIFGISSVRNRELAPLDSPISPHFSDKIFRREQRQNPRRANQKFCGFARRPAHNPILNTELCW